jgi:hypothetical protein
MILITDLKAVELVAGALVVGGALAYGFRGLLNREGKQVEGAVVAKVFSAATTVQTDVSKEVAKL